MKIGLIGYGVVGKAMEYTLNPEFEVKKYDKYAESDSFENVCNCDLIFIIVPTPFDYDSNEVDLSAIQESLIKLSEANFEGVVVIKSTIPPNTTKILSDKYENLELCFNPEFLRERLAKEECANQDIVVIGTPKREVFYLLKYIYQKVLPSHSKYFHVSTTEAEMVKYCLNTTFASRVCVANIIYDVCEKFDVDYDKVKEIGFYEFDWFGLDKGGIHMVEVPGPDGRRGFGGKCLPKDIAGFNSIAKSEVISEIISYNNSIRKTDV